MKKATLKTLNKIITKLIPSLLLVVLLVSTISDFSADMFVRGNGSAKRRTETTQQEEPRQSVPNNEPRQIQTSLGGGNAQTASVSGPYMNPLTGLGSATDITRNRPVAVSISNQKGALPSNATNGISQADIVYEFMVEGGITRFVGVYQDISTVGTIGSIRSARHYMVQIAESHDAFWVHAGGSPLGFEEIEKRSIDNFCSVQGIRNSVFTKNVNRVPGHTVGDYHGMTANGASIAQRILTSDMRKTHNSNYIQPYFFTDSHPVKNGADASKVSIKYSAAKDSIFTYDSSRNLYFMNQFGSQFTDANNNAPVAFTNLILIDMPTYDLVGHGSGAGRQDMETVGSGNGYLVSGGKYEKIIWLRPDKESPFIFGYENGDLIELSRGKTYIGLVPSITNVTVS